MTSSANPSGEAQARAVRLIQKQFGPISDLPRQLWPVIWVTACRSCEVGMYIEAAGGANAFVKAALGGAPYSGFEMEMSIRRLELLGEMITLIRKSESEWERLGTAQLLIDILKWGIDNASEISVLRRLIARKFARADSFYAEPVPSEIL